MAQHDYDIANQSGANFRADLNNALDAIVSNNSGSSEPSTTFAYEWWIDTSNNLLKLRNSANNAWITLPLSITADNSTSGALTVNGNLSTTGTLDVNGGEVILDADADTSITADTDDQIDIKIAGADVYTVTASSFDFNGKELILDADADSSITADTDDQIDIKIGGTDVMQLTNSSSDFVFKNPVQDKDIVFKGNDGGSEITALTIDMSNVGDAVFRRQVTLREALYINNADNTATVGYIHNDGNDLVLRNFVSTGNITFKTNATERTRIDSSGNFLVDRTAGSVGQGLQFLVAENGANKGQFNIGTQAFQTEKTISLYSTAFPAYTFYVTAGGTIHAINTTITSLSDERLKKNIRDLDDGLDKVMQLQPRKFDWKEGQGKDIANDIGFISQEFEKVFPDMVGEWDDETQEEKYKTINANIIPTLTKAIQEQQGIIENLKSRIETLEG